MKTNWKGLERFAFWSMAVALSTRVLCDCYFSSIYPNSSVNLIPSKNPKYEKVWYTIDSPDRDIIGIHAEEPRMERQVVFYTHNLDNAGFPDQITIYPPEHIITNKTEMTGWTNAYRIARNSQQK